MQFLTNFNKMSSSQTFQTDARFLLKAVQLQDLNLPFLLSAFVHFGQEKYLYEPNLSHDIFSLCEKFLIVPLYKTPEKDPVNFVTKEEKKLAQQYKTIGNKFFKSKKYDDAII